MSFVLKEKKLTKTKICRKPSQWTWVQGYRSPSQNATEDPETAAVSPVAEDQHCLLPGEWSSHKGSIQIKIKLVKQGSRLTALSTLSRRPPQALIQHGAGLHLAQVQDSPLPIPSRLPFTFSQVHWKATIRETHILGYRTVWVEHACLGETQLLTRVILLWLKMSVINNFLFKKYQVKCKL